jgi:hypothetical protein
LTIAKSSTNQEFIRPLDNRLRRAGDGRVKDGRVKGEPPYRYRLVPDWTCDRKILQRIFTDYANLEPARDIAAGSIVKQPLQEKYKALELERVGPAHKLRLVEADGGSNVVTLSVLWFIQH